MNEEMRIIRDAVDTPEQFFMLSKNKPLKAQLNSSMDTLEDTVLAIESYIESKVKEEDGNMYVLTYGILQALILQQDAVKHMFEALQISYNDTKYPYLKEIREIRNDSIGHPTKRNSRTFHFISRNTMSKKGFRLESIDRNGIMNYRKIEIYKLISKQKEIIENILNDGIKDLVVRERAIKKKYREEKLIPVFDNVKRRFMDIYESLDDREMAEWALQSLKSVNDSLQNLQNLLQKRKLDIDAYQSLKDNCDDVQYALPKVEGFFLALMERRKSFFNKRDALIYTDYSERRIEKIKEIVQEIDDYYSK